MSIWIPLGAILLSGAVGGIINALFTDDGFIMPREEIADNVCILRPGVVGNVCWDLLQLSSRGGFTALIVGLSFLEL